MMLEETNKSVPTATFPTLRLSLLKVTVVALIVDMELPPTTTPFR
jgi:hypothetical protein